MRKAILVCVIVVLAMGALVLLREVLRRPAGPPEAAKPLPVRVVTLYFGSVDGTALVPEQLEIAASEKALDGLRPVLEALVGGPREGGVALFPDGTSVRGVYITDRTAYIDFSRELVEGFSGGTSGEYLLVASVVQTVCANFPDLDSVRLLVEGKEVDTIGGHLNVSKPLRPKDWR
jgi:spore germination protein GerM